MLLVGFALVVLLMQMIAVNRISTPSRYPWEYEGAERGESEPGGRKRRGDERTEQPAPLEHVSEKK